MISILVVDDSPVDRRLVGELLSKNPGVQVQYAVDGAETVDSKSVGELAAGVPTVQIDYAFDGRDALSKLARRSAGPHPHRPDDAGDQRSAVGRGRAGELP